MNDFHYLLHVNFFVAIVFDFVSSLSGTREFWNPNNDWYLKDFCGNWTNFWEWNPTFEIGKRNLEDSLIVENLFKQDFFKKERMKELLSES